MTRAVRAALARAPALDEWIEPRLVEARRWRPWNQALAAAHAPENAADLEPDTPARSRLAYDELLANQMALALVRRSARGGRGRSIKGDGRLRRALETALPFRLTESQQAAASEIAEDLAKERRMLRLLQGDVGSGKTVVALLAMLVAVEAGAQAALMVPTELLANQHAETLGTLLAESGVSLALLTGREKGRARDRRLWRHWPPARSISWSAPTRCSRRAWTSRTSRWPWSTSSTASACISACCSHARGRRRTCW